MHHCRCRSQQILQHDHTHTATLGWVSIVLGVYSTGDRGHAIVVEIVVELTIARSEFLLFEEEGLVEIGHGVEDIKTKL